MSEESKKPPEFGPVPQFRTHFELWDAAEPRPVIEAPIPSPQSSTELGMAPPSIQTAPVERPIVHDANAPPLHSDRRPWNKPVLTTTPFARPRPPVAPPILRWSPSQIAIAGAVIGALLAIVGMLPRKHFASSPSAPEMTAQPAMKSAAAAPVLPAVAKPDQKAAEEPPQAAPIAAASNTLVAPPAKLAAVAPMKPAAMPSILAAVKPVQAVPTIAPRQPVAASPPVMLDKPSMQLNVATLPVVRPMIKRAPSAPAVEPSASDETGPDQNDQGDKLRSEPAPIHAELLEASVRNQLTQEGYDNLGVSVNPQGDVFLGGTFLSEADRDRIMAQIRANPQVRDIYFSGTVWESEQASAPSPQAPVENALAAKPAGSTQPPAQQPEEFPVTAADVPALRTRNPPSPIENPTAAQTLAPP